MPSAICGRIGIGGVGATGCTGVLWWVGAGACYRHVWVCMLCFSWCGYRSYICFFIYIYYFYFFRCFLCWVLSTVSKPVAQSFVGWTTDFWGWGEKRLSRARKKCLVQGNAPEFGRRLLWWVPLFLRNAPMCRCTTRTTTQRTETQRPS
jgi:hypothetical protein